MVARFDLGPDDHVVEVATNDGTLLQFFKESGIPCTGIEPTASTAEAARARGIDVVEEFLTVKSASRFRSIRPAANLLAANNVLAHVPDIVGFATGCRLLLADDGVATFEFPHLVELVDNAQFDTVYHEHFSYLSLTAVEGVFRLAGMDLFDVEVLGTHGGSLRVFAQPRSTGVHASTGRLVEVRQSEERRGVASSGFYEGFQERTDVIREVLVDFLGTAKADGREVVGYGAAAKGNTLLNYSGIGPELLPIVADRNPAKQGCLLPGSRIPVVGPDEIFRRRPSHVLILPWNLRDEVAEQLSAIREWGGTFVVAVPRLETW
ncbi:MAG: class I SAM-dependent methyltransferase [Acidimicrobiales bacterium]|nr:class I SAM-dependent methyltransferase [Acidimicrobiales bacterium]